MSNPRPKGSRAYLVRYPRRTRDEWRHRFYLHDAPARTRVQLLRALGIDARLYVTATNWQPDDAPMCQTRTTSTP